MRERKSIFTGVFASKKTKPFAGCFEMENE
jgi:hypothetical protein